MSTQKIVQLTKRNPDAKWKTKNKETGKIEFLEMADMEDRHLQAALVITQKRMVLNFMALINDNKRMKQLKQEAKNRNMDIKDLDHIKNTYLASKFMEFEEMMNSAMNSADRKKKQLDSIDYDAKAITK